jgi:hypothetical protein
MFVILTAFTLFHLAAGMASLGLGMRLLTGEEAAYWRSKRALLVARLLCWVYPALGFFCASAAWRVFEQAAPHALPIMLVPLVWLLVMDGVLGNARVRE